MTPATPKAESGYYNIPRNLYNNTLLVSYLGQAVGPIRLDDLQECTSVRIITWGKRVFLDANEPAVQQSLQNGVLHYFATESSAPAFSIHGAPLIIYNVTLHPVSDATLVTKQKETG